MCIDMCMEVCIGMCKEVCIDMCMDGTCTGKCDLCMLHRHAARALHTHVHVCCLHTADLFRFIFNFIFFGDHLAESPRPFIHGTVGPAVPAAAVHLISLDHRHAV